MIFALLLAMAGADEFSAVTTRRRAEALAERWRQCGSPKMVAMSRGRARVSIRLEADDDYVVADCIASQARDVRLKHAGTGAKP